MTQVSTRRGKGVGKSSNFDDFSTPRTSHTTKVVCSNGKSMMKMTTLNDTLLSSKNVKKGVN